MPSSPADDFSPLGRSIGRAHKFARTWGDRELAPLGSSVTEFIVLFHVASAPSPGASQSDIARFSDMGGPALVRHVDRLEAEGILRRQRDADDRRIIRLSLTDAGHERLAQIQQVMARIDQQMRAVIGEDVAAVVQQALDQLFTFTLGELTRSGDLPPGPPPGEIARHRRKATR